MTSEEKYLFIEAARSGRTQELTRMLDRGADPSFRNIDDDTPPAPCRPERTCRLPPSSSFSRRGPLRPQQRRRHAAPYHDLE